MHAYRTIYGYLALVFMLAGCQHNIRTPELVFPPENTSSGRVRLFAPEHGGGTVWCMQVSCPLDTPLANLRDLQQGSDASVHGTALEIECGPHRIGKLIMPPETFFLYRDIPALPGQKIQLMNDYAVYNACFTGPVTIESYRHWRVQETTR